MNYTRPLILLCAFMILLADGPLGWTQQRDRTTVSSDPGKPSANPRLVRITHGPEKGRIISVIAPNVVYESSDEGATFYKIGSINFRPSVTRQCCGVLYEMPHAVGSIQAGTLLYSADFCEGVIMSTDIYSSEDSGKSWRFLAAPVKGGACDNGRPVKKRGLWEPEFEVSSDGALVMFWSDETDPCCSQKLSRIRTYDGINWQDKGDLVALREFAARPGMAVVSKTPHGFYFMTYELCGTQNCNVMFRISRDGWNFGATSDPGREIVTRSGRYFQHAPRNIWFEAEDKETPFGSAAPGSGALIVVGQVLHEANHSISRQDGEIVFWNPAEDGSGEWTSAPAPVKIPDAASGTYNVCQNYSSSLLPVHGGSALLEMASDWTAPGVCGSFFATEPFRH